jgi:hypothetical protein
LPLPIGRLSDVRKQHHLWCFSPPETLSACTFFLLAASPVVGIWFTALGVNSMAFNLNGFNNPPIGGDSSLNSSLVGKVKG